MNFRRFYILIFCTVCTIQSARAGICEDVLSLAGIDAEKKVSKSDVAHEILFNEIPNSKVIDQFYLMRQMARLPSSIYFRDMEIKKESDRDHFLTALWSSRERASAFDIVAHEWNRLVERIKAYEGLESDIDSAAWIHVQSFKIGLLLARLLSNVEHAKQLKFKNPQSDIAVKFKNYWSTESQYFKEIFGMTIQVQNLVQRFLSKSLTGSMSPKAQAEFWTYLSAYRSMVKEFDEAYQDFGMFNNEFVAPDYLDSLKQITRRYSFELNYEDLLILANSQIQAAKKWRLTVRGIVASNHAEFLLKILANRIQIMERLGLFLGRFGYDKEAWDRVSEQEDRMNKLLTELVTPEYLETVDKIDRDNVHKLDYEDLLALIGAQIQVAKTWSSETRGIAAKKHAEFLLDTLESRLQTMERLGLLSGQFHYGAAQWNRYLEVGEKIKMLRARLL